MVESELELTGEGAIQQMFRASGCGSVVVLENGFSGTVATGSLLEGPSGRASIKSVEMVDGVNGQSRIALVIDESAGSLFATGQQIKFYKRRSRHTAC